MVHGGCWQKEIADRTLMNYAAEDLRQKGLAIWNVEYRGVDEEGGGYPGTFTDVARAADALRLAAAEHELDLETVVAFGHSAGGHLALWLAARPNLPATSPLYTDDPLSITAVVNSGGLADLEASAPITQEGCLSSIMDVLTGVPSTQRPNVFSDTSPSELLPIAAVQVSMNGDSDRIAPSLLGKAYTQKARAAGDPAEFVELPNSGHVELITPGTSAFESESEMLLRLLNR
jgi:acetyl esterase/lipase